MRLKIGDFVVYEGEKGEVRSVGKLFAQIALPSCEHLGITTTVLKCNLIPVGENTWKYIRK